ncbi:MAG: DUF2384 domain-containing protein [Firmicutes bacterium]|nr:DUF2384 domain-containing protein [Bacillota bacterium]
MKWERNDPCPCGSGEKYKDCCLKGEVADFQQYKWRRLAEEMQEQLLYFAEEERFTDDSEAAFQAYLNVVSDNLFESVEEPAFVSFIDWFIYDYRLRSQGRNLIQCYLAEKEKELGPMEVKLLRDWADSHITLLRVLAVGKEWLTLEDLLTGGEFPVWGKSLAEGMVPGALLLGRPVKVGDNYQLSGAALEFTPLLRDEILAIVTGCYSTWQKELRGGTWQKFLKQKGFMLPSLIAAALGEEESGLPPSREELAGGLPKGDAGAEPLNQHLVVQMLDQYYRQWVDLAIPAFAGRTPREMCRTPEGRKKVEVLLDSLEQFELAKRDEGEAYFDFSNIRALLGLPLKSSSRHRLPDPSYREVKRLLEEKGANQSWLRAAKKVWHDFYKEARPQVKKANAWAAAVEYTMARLFADKDVTQKDLAKMYQVAPATISNHYRTIWHTLDLERWGQYYIR